MHIQTKTISGAILSFDAVCAGSPVIIMLQKCKQTSTRKIEILSLIRDHRKKVWKQGRLPAPSDILVSGFPTFFSMIPNQT